MEQHLPKQGSLQMNYSQTSTFSFPSPSFQQAWGEADAEAMLISQPEDLSCALGSVPLPVQCSCSAGAAGVGESLLRALSGAHCNPSPESSLAGAQHSPNR